MQHFKDRIECFHDYSDVLGKGKDCNLDYVYNYIKLVVSMYKNIVLQENNLNLVEELIISIKLTRPLKNDER